MKIGCTICCYCYYNVNQFLDCSHSTQSLTLHDVKKLSKHILPTWPCHPRQVCNTNSTSFHDDGDGDHISGACASWRGSTHKSRCTRRRSTKAARRPRHTTTSRTSSSWPTSPSSENSESLRLVTCHNLLVLSSKLAGSDLNQLGSVGCGSGPNEFCTLACFQIGSIWPKPGNDTVTQPEPNQIWAGFAEHYQAWNWKWDTGTWVVAG